MFNCYIYSFERVLTSLVDEKPFKYTPQYLWLPSRDTATAEKSKPNKIPRLSNLDVCEFMITNKIKTDTELFAKANEQKEAGKKDLANFIVSRSPKSLQDLISNAWKMESTKSTLARKDRKIIEVVRECADGECVWVL